MMTPAAPSPLAERNANVQTPLTGKKAATKPVDIMKTGNQQDVDDLVCLFKDLALDGSISDAERQMKVASLLELGEEASMAVQKKRLEREGGDGVEPTEVKRNAEEVPAKVQEEKPAEAQPAPGALSWMWKSLTNVVSLTFRPAVGTAQADSSYDSDECYTEDY